MIFWRGGGGDTLGGTLGWELLGGGGRLAVCGDRFVMGIESLVFRPLAARSGHLLISGRQMHLLCSSVRNDASAYF